MKPAQQYRWLHEPGAIFSAYYKKTKAAEIQIPLPPWYSFPDIQSPSAVFLFTQVKLAVNFRALNNGTLSSLPLS